MRSLLLFLLPFVWACASVHRPSVGNKSPERSSNPSFASSMHQQSLGSDFERERQMVLQTKQRSRAVAAVPARSLSQIHQELIDAYDKKNEVIFRLKAQELEKRSPGTYRVKIAYLQGMLSLSSRSYGVALKNFDEVIKTSPKSNWGRQAKYAKAITYKRMNLPEVARKVLSDLIQRHPSTVEGQRARLELDSMKGLHQ